MGSKIVQARSIRGNDVVLASTADELLALLAFYQGTSISDPNYLVGVTIQLLPIDYTFTQAQLPLLVRGGMSLRGTGVGQTRLISAQTTSVGAKPIVSCLLPYGGRAYNVNLTGFSIVGDAYATAGIYVKGLQTSTIEYIQITNMGATGSIGVQIDAAVGFGVYYNTIQSVEVGFSAGSGATIGFRLKTIDYPAQLRRANSNNLIMCSAKYNVDAAYELDACIGITMTACEAEVNSVGLRILNCSSTVVSGGYFENNTSSDIQLGELSGAAQSSAQTCLLNPYLTSTTRLSGLSRGSTGDVYLLSNSSSAPGSTNYDRTWLEKAHIKNLSSNYIEHWAYPTVNKVGYYRFSGDANYRLTISNDGTMDWGTGGAAADVSLFRAQADVLALATNDSFRLNGTGFLIWGSASGVAPDVLMSRMSADILGLANNDSWQLNGTGKMLWSTASSTTADTGLERLTATTNGTLSAINLCDVRVVGAFNNGRLRLGNYYLYVDASANLRMSVGEPASDGAGTNISYGGGAPGVTTINYTKMQDTNITAVTVTNTVTETPIYTYSVPASTLSTNRALRFTLNGTYLNDSTANRTVQIKVKYGASTILNATTGVIPFSSTLGSFYITGGMAAQNSASIQGAWMTCSFEGGDNITRWIEDRGVAAEDSTGVLDFVVTATFASSTATQTLVRRFATLELLNASDTIGAPTNSSYVTLGTDANLSAERVLTGTANQVVITDNGAGSSVVLSTPQNIATTSSPTFAAMTLGQASTTQGSLVLYGTGGANAHTLRAATTPAAANTYIWPSADPAAGTVLTASAPSSGAVTLTWATGGSTGTVTATAGTLTSNAIILGAGTTDTKVAAGIITDGASVITLGVNATTIGKIKFFGNTSGDATIQPAAIAGTATVITLPAVTGTLATLAGTETLTNKTITATAKATYGAIVKVPIDYTPAAAGTATLDCSLGDTHRILMPAGNITIALTNITNGQMIQIAITQPSVGSRLVTWFSTIKWAGGVAPVLTTTALKRSVIGIMCTGTATYDGYVIGLNI